MKFFFNMINRSYKSFRWEKKSKTKNRKAKGFCLNSWSKPKWEFNDIDQIEARAINFIFSMMKRSREHGEMLKKVRDEKMLQFQLRPKFMNFDQNSNFTKSTRWMRETIKFFFSMIKRSSKHFAMMRKIKDQKCKIWYLDIPLFTDQLEKVIFFYYNSETFPGNFFLIDHHIVKSTVVWNISRVLFIQSVHS